MSKCVFVIVSSLCALACSSQTGLKSQLESTAPCSAHSKNTYVCLDFENGITKGMQLGPNVLLQNSVAHSGSAALYFSTNNKKDGSRTWYGGFINTSYSVPGTHWGRMFYRIQKIDDAADYTHITFVSASAPSSDVRLVDTVLGPQGRHQYLYNFPDDQGGRASDYRWRFDDRWVCVEWHVDAASQRYEFYREGERVGEISGNVADDHGGIPRAYSSLYFGGQVYQNGPEVSGWIDNIVVARDRSFCF